MPNGSGRVALFYNLITFFRQQVLPQWESRHTLQALRLKYFAIAAAALLSICRAAVLASD